MRAKLIVVTGKASKREVNLRLPTIIGRSQDADMTIAHGSISRRHCELYEENGLLMIRDLGSLNGTLIGERRVLQGPLLPEGEFTVGPLTFRADYRYDGDLDEIPVTRFADEGEEDQTELEPIEQTVQKDLDGELDDFEAALAEEVAGAAHDTPLAALAAAPADNEDFPDWLDEDAEAEALVEAEPEPEVVAELEPVVEPAEDAKPQAIPETVATMASDALAASEEQPESDAVADPIALAEPELLADPEMLAEPVALAEPMALAEPDLLAELVALAEPEMLAEPEFVEELTALDESAPIEEAQPVEPEVIAEAEIAEAEFVEELAPLDEAEFVEVEEGASQSEMAPPAPAQFQPAPDQSLQPALTAVPVAAATAVSAGNDEMPEFCVGEERKEVPPLEAGYQDLGSFLDGLQ